MPLPAANVSGLQLGNATVQGGGFGTLKDVEGMMRIAQMLGWKTPAMKEEEAKQASAAQGLADMFSPAVSNATQQQVADIGAPQPSSFNTIKEYQQAANQFNQAATGVERAGAANAAIRNIAASLPPGSLAAFGQMLVDKNKPAPRVPLNKVSPGEGVIDPATGNVTIPIPKEPSTPTSSELDNVLWLMKIDPAKASPEDRQNAYSKWMQDAAIIAGAKAGAGETGRGEANLNVPVTDANVIRSYRDSSGGTPKLGMTLNEIIKAGFAPTKTTKVLSPTDVGKITTGENSIAMLDTLVSTFQPEYGGKTLTGGLSNLAQEKLGVGSSDAQVQWWKNFHSMDNITRHELYGSALTSTEVKAWEKTTISESSTPKAIESAVKERARILKDVHNRSLNNLGKAGYDTYDFTRYEKTPLEKSTGGLTTMSTEELLKLKAKLGNK